VNHLENGQRLLLARSVTGMRFAALLDPLLLSARSPLGGVAKERLGAARQLFVEALDLERKTPGSLAAHLTRDTKTHAAGRRLRVQVSDLLDGCRRKALHD